MTSTLIPVLEELKEFKKLNVIDVGSARGSFMMELRRVYDNNIFSIAIDPIDHGIGGEYSKFYHACVDNVEKPIKVEFFKNSKDDQASSLFSTEGENMGEIDVFNLNDIIKDEIPTETIHFIKIDAEGKDLHIVKSLKDDTLSRIVYIAIECTQTSPRFEEEFGKGDCIDYFKSIGFDMHYCHDTNNGTNISDVVFKNRSLS